MPESERPPLERQSDAWVSYLQPWIKRRIDKLRDELELPEVDVVETRGRILELRELTRLIEPDAPESGSAGTY